MAPTGALSKDRGSEPQTWSEVPKSAYKPQARLPRWTRTALIVRCYILGGRYQRRDYRRNQGSRPSDRMRAVYNDWIIDVWAASSDSSPGHPTHRIG